jgi:hypothetical protein
MVEAKMGDWLDFTEFTVYKWVRRNTVDRFSFFNPSHARADDEAAWQQREDVMGALENYLSDMPSTLFQHLS